MSLNNITLDVEYVKAQFPAFKDPLSSKWTFVENAGGSYVPYNVINHLNDFMTSTKVQPYAEYPMAKIAGENMDEATELFSQMINAKNKEIVIGGSTSINLYVLSNSLKYFIKPGDEVIVTDQDHEANISPWRRLSEVGAKIKVSKKQIHISGPKKIKNLTNLVTKEYPNFPTDSQAQFMVLLCKAKGKSSITESIFENRFMHVAELRRLGAEILIKKNKAFISGDTNFQAAELMSSDLRASVALVLAAIVATGSSTINRIYHLDRGYENIENKLRKVGVNIRRVN